MNKHMQMKKLRVLAVVAALIVSGVATAQVNFGVKGGLNLTSMKLSNEVLKTSNRTGFFIGPTMRVKTGTFVAFDLSALYNERSFRLSENFTESPEVAASGMGETVFDMEPTSVKQRAVDIPLNVRLQFGWVYLAAGPQMTFNLGKSIDLASGEWYKTTFRPKESTFSINFGAGVTLGHVEVSVTYNIACGNTGEISYQRIADEVKENVKFMDSKQNVWQLSAALYF